MGYNLRALLNECKKSTGSNNCEMVWKALINVMAETLRTGKGCSIRNLLSITSIRTSMRDPKPGLKDHVFFLAPSICKSYGLSFRKPGSALLSPCIEANISKMVVMTKLDKDSVVGAMKTIISKLAEFMGSGDHVQVPFGNLGILLCQKRVASFKFASSGIAAPNMVQSILTDAIRNGGMMSETGSFVDQFMTRKASERAAADAAVAAAEDQQRQEAERQERADQEAACQAQAAAEAAAAQAAASSQLPLPSPSPAPSSRGPTSRSPAVSSRSYRERDNLNQSDDTPPWLKNSYAVKKDKLEETMANHVFPKFLIPERHKSLETTNPAVIRNMEIAYDRLEGTIADATAARAKQEAEFKALQEKGFAEYMSRRTKEANLRKDIRESLDVQCMDDRRRRMEAIERDRKEISETFKGLHNAYPMAKPLDLAHEYSVKKNLRDSLLAQCTTKQQEDKAKRKANIAREQNILNVLNNNLKKEREEIWAGKQGGDKLMSLEWEKQITTSK
eukprot:CAMPEP_0118633644 /NCGR_PEP_ID=MMETSP0785-20121206/1112_1 /TAXON_ID=91992 /ORGANISM="Bolidomonas pacifica, Strain CCMP 1866" /LENGTH=504 /DNA_ID=CAMNT_0006524543 /DNA_START=30 /DNA_END=1541 /DNA_ORIENTATION=+